MAHVEYRKEGEVAVLTLSRPKANAIHRAMLDEMASAFDRALIEAKAIVWSSSQPRFFSAGFDVKEVFEYSPEEMAGFLAAFSRLQQRVLDSPRPTVAALPGQTYAGGAILALSCDFRVMADGPFGLALTEINIGVNVPASVFALLQAAVGTAWAQRMFLSGEPLPAQQALVLGAVHSLAPIDEVERRAIDLATSLAAKPAETYRGIKNTILGATGREPTPAPLVDIAAWFTPEAEQWKRRLKEQLRS